jgi:hypothetical protein
MIVFIAIGIVEVVGTAAGFRGKRTIEKAAAGVAGVNTATTASATVAFTTTASTTPTTGRGRRRGRSGGRGLFAGCGVDAA